MYLILKSFHFVLYSLIDKSSLISHLSQSRGICEGSLGTRSEISIVVVISEIPLEFQRLSTKSLLLEPRPPVRIYTIQTK